MTFLSRLHPALVHFPIATSILALVTLGLYLALKREELRWMWAFLAAVAALAALPAVATGIIAATGKGYMSGGLFPTNDFPRIQNHETLGLLGTALSFALAYLAYRTYQTGNLLVVPTLFLAAGLAVVWGMAGHLGGEQFWRDELFAWGDEHPVPHLPDTLVAKPQTTYTPPAQAADESLFAPLEEGKDYKTYAKMNTEAWQSESHGDRWVNTYVNAVGASAYQTAKPLPVGSVVVKESFADSSGKAGQPELLYVMVKREPEYAPERGNWFYAVYWNNVPAAFEKQYGKQTYWRGKSKKVNFCNSCHADYDRTDYLGGIPKPVKAHPASY